MDIEMNVLVLNCGSSTLKFALFEAELTAEGAVAEQQLARGVVDQIGRSGKLQVRVGDGGTLSPVTGLTSHEDAIRAVLDWLRSSGLTDRVRLSAIGHRVVHGGDRFSGPIKLSDEVVRELEGVTELAPLHNRPALDVIRTCCAVLGIEVPMVAVFDTAFHATLPPRARYYAIPAELTRQYAIQRYGFHGLAHRFMTERWTPPWA
jgi:acetate kinase